MTMTVNSGASPYCSAANFVVFFDWRTFAQLASDTDTPLASSAALQASPVLAAQLSIGAGLIETAVTVSQRYDPADLAVLAATTTNSAYMLFELNASLAAAGMFGRRFEGAPPEIKEKIDNAILKLQALEEGVNIFGFSQVQQAGIISDYKETPYDVQQRNLPSWVARRCVGIRDNMRTPYQR